MKAAMLDKEKMLVVTVGLPRSGKTTWCRWFRDRTGGVILCADAVRLALHGQPFSECAEPHVWAMMKTMAWALFLAGNNPVIIDATNTTRARRKEWETLSAGRWITVYKEVLTPLNVCVERAGDNPGLVGAIHRMYKHYEALGPNEQIIKGYIAEEVSPGGT